MIAIYFARPAARTQPAAEHALKSLQDLNGRDAEQLAALISHDRLTLLSQFALVLAAYRFLPGCYPSASDVVDALPVRAVKLLAHHYLLSFGMYWMHRSLHVIDPLWRHIHSIHHWAKHPLSRNTYQDHWMENFANALVGELLAQILVPIDHGCFGSWRASRNTRASADSTISHIASSGGCRMHKPLTITTGITKGTKAATTRLPRSAASGTASSARAS